MDNYDESENENDEEIPDYFLVNEENDGYESMYKTPLSPNAPWTRKPYCKFCIYANNFNELFNMESSYNNNNIQMSIFFKVSCNTQTKESTEIFHTSPKWITPMELEIIDEENDIIVIEFYATGIYDNINNNGYRNKLRTNISYPYYLGFQIIPVRFFQGSNQIVNRTHINLQLIPKKCSEYFTGDENDVLNINNYNPTSFIVNKDNDKNTNKLPYVTIVFTYYNNNGLNWICCTVYNILERQEKESEDNYSENKTMIYNLYIKRMDGNNWYKEASISEIEDFKNNLISYNKEIANIPFPTKSMLSFLPLIGKYYEENDNKSIMKRVKMLNNFFNVVCNNVSLYSVEEFNTFFTETVI